MRNKGNVFEKRINCIEICIEIPMDIIQYNYCKKKIIRKQSTLNFYMREMQRKLVEKFD